MKNIDKIYSDLTGVDINEQYKLWDERGKGYYGEYLVFREIYRYIPGNCKVLMNLQIPYLYGKKTEIDLLMIHETGLYVFEIKHYKGTIYGNVNDSRWTQYFRTTQNQSFKNPIKQNQYHINALKQLYPDLPIHSFIVFTNENCELKITGTEPNMSLCELYCLCNKIKSLLHNKTEILSMEKIDDLFNKLSIYTPMKNEIVMIENEPVPFYLYINEIIKNYKESVEENKIKLKNAKIKAILICLTCFICSVGACFISNKHYQKQIAIAEQELATFAKKFEYVEEFNNGNLIFSKDLVTVSDIVLEESKDIKNAINFSCKLNSNGVNYGVSIGENVKFIVMLNNGTIKEYDLWNETYPYTSPYKVGGSIFTADGKIGVHEFYDIKINDITYIKLINLDIYSKKDYTLENIASGYEIELYKKEK